MESLKLIADCIHASVDVRVYRIVAVQKTAYRFAARVTAMLGAPMEHALPITFRFTPNTTEDAALEIVRAFFQELIDQELREHIGDETRAIRALVLAHAFSRTGLVDK